MVYLLVRPTQFVFLIFSITLPLFERRDISFPFTQEIRLGIQQISIMALIYLSPQVWTSIVTIQFFKLQTETINDIPNPSTQLSSFSQLIILFFQKLQFRRLLLPHQQTPLWKTAAQTLPQRVTMRFFLASQFLCIIFFLEFFIQLCFQHVGYKILHLCRQLTHQPIVNPPLRTGVQMSYLMLMWIHPRVLN